MHPQLPFVEGEREREGLAVGWAAADVDGRGESILRTPRVNRVTCAARFPLPRGLHSFSSPFSLSFLLGPPFGAVTQITAIGCGGGQPAADLKGSPLLVRIHPPRTRTRVMSAPSLPLHAVRWESEARVLPRPFRRP